jgi:hypothetical protein
MRVHMLMPCSYDAQMQGKHQRCYSRDDREKEIHKNLKDQEFVLTPAFDPALLQVWILNLILFLRT